MENIIRNLQLIENKNQHMPKVDVVSTLKGAVEMLNFRIKTLENRDVAPDLLINQTCEYEISDLEDNIISKNRIKLVKFDYIRNVYIFKLVDFIFIGSDKIDLSHNFIETPINCFPFHIKNKLKHNFKF